MKTGKNLLVMFALLGILSACANTTSDHQAGKTDDPYEIMKKKREYYKSLELREEDNLKEGKEQKSDLEEAYKILEKKREKYKN